MTDLEFLGVVERPETTAEVVMNEALRGRTVRLSGRQRQLAVLMSHGLPGKEQAYRLGIKVGTWKIYMWVLHNEKQLTNADLVMIGLALRLSGRAEVD